MGRFCREILTSEARSYIQSVGLALKLWARAEKFRPIDAYALLDLWFILPRTNADNHNYFKCLFDALEAGGIVTNDKFILPHVMGVWHDAKNPQVVVKLLSTPATAPKNTKPCCLCPDKHYPECPRISNGQ